MLNRFGKTKGSLSSTLLSSLSQLELILYKYYTWTVSSGNNTKLFDVS